ncbi:MAG TPA: hypothetical protein VGN73_11560 [Gemmatimonadaceae bacterium]|nr:hypothetical protein [Gemmatimonadaceae bacterium]
MGLRYPLDFDGYRVHRRFDFLETFIDRTQLARRHRARLQPLRDQADYRESKYDGYYSWHYPGENFVNDKVWIRRHWLPGLDFYYNEKQHITDSIRNIDGKRIALWTSTKQM